MAYLKYYFSLVEGNLNLNSLPCIEGQEIKFPKNFLKWYEDGDIDVVLDKEIFNVNNYSFLTIMFSPRKVMFDIKDFIWSE